MGRYRAAYRSQDCCRLWAIKQPANLAVPHGQFCNNPPTDQTIMVRIVADLKPLNRRTV